MAPNLHGKTFLVTGSTDGVRKFAEKVKADHASVDVLVNNAGIFSKQRTLSKDGYELTWAVNALAPFLLTSLLLGRLKERMVNVGSAALASHINLNDLQQGNSYTGYGASAQSKLANLRFTMELVSRMQAKTVTVNCVHPGVHRTKVLNDGWGSGVGDVKGADDVFNLSVGKEFGEQTGKFYSGQGPMQVPDCAQAKALSQQLFQLMQEQIGAQFNC